MDDGTVRTFKPSSQEKCPPRWSCMDRLIQWIYIRTLYLSKWKMHVSKPSVSVLYGKNTNSVDIYQNSVSQSVNGWIYIMHYYIVHTYPFVLNLGK